MPHTHSVKKTLYGNLCHTCILTEIHPEARCKFSTPGTMPVRKYLGLWTIWISEFWMRDPQPVLIIFVCVCFYFLICKNEDKNQRISQGCS